MADPSENGVTFALEDEDHTLANALRFMLNKNPHVEFCGYSIPHPTDAVVNLRVQTTGEITAQEALREALLNLKAACAHIKTTFQAEVAEKREEMANAMEA